jgi:hypothetical protein
MDSTHAQLIREREATAGVGRVPQLMAFMHALNKQRLDEPDSADVWMARATAKPYPEGGLIRRWLPSTLALVRIGQGRLVEGHAAAAQLPDGTRGRRAIAALVHASLLRDEGKEAQALQLLETAMGALYRESPATLSSFTLPLVTAGELHLAAGDARGADSLAQLGWQAAALDSLARTRSGLAGRADLLRARALRVLGDTAQFRAVSQRAIAALGNGYGVESKWAREARALGDSLGLPR